MKKYYNKFNDNKYNNGYAYSAAAAEEEEKEEKRR